MGAAHRMRNFGTMRGGWRAVLRAALLPTIALLGTSSLAAQQVDLICNPEQSRADWTLTDPLHTVKGDFKLKSCDMRYDMSTRQAQGNIVFDATSGQSGNSSRDHKMHKDVLESGKYPEIRFRLDHVEGVVAREGVSTLQVHGTFGIHGADHEMTIPVELKLDQSQWTATAKFPVPYVKWGMKNPSLLFIHVGDAVDIDFRGAGSLAREPGK
jgi:polyisoprenoid-binding protein YceI